ncbi:uncharacterized protein LOC144201903 isoform X1 [Stigmatopora nigra]
MTPEEGRVCVRALQSSSKVTICRRNPAKLLTERCCTFYPQRAQTAGKHQECGQNDQKGATCRRHNKNSTRGWRRFDFLRCWSTNGNQSMKFFKIKVFLNSTRGWRRFDFLRCCNTSGNLSTNFFKIKADFLFFQISCW